MRYGLAAVEQDLGSHLTTYQRHVTVSRKYLIKKLKAAARTITWIRHRLKQNAGCAPDRAPPEGVRAVTWALLAGPAMPLALWHPCMRVL
jgi:hypothetical protein